MYIEKNALPIMKEEKGNEEAWIKIKKAKPLLHI